MEKRSETLPEEMIKEIMLRMPLKSLVKCICASKNLASIIRRKDFKNDYLVRSMKKPRLLFIDSEVFKRDVVFHSVYQEEKPLLSSGQQQMCILLHPQWNVSHPIRGLICIQEQTKVTICNMGAKKFHILPKIEAQREGSVRSFFGYDKDGDVFKVLCMTKSELNESEECKEHRVLTVGSGEEFWRPISCEHHHCPVTQGLCKGGVLYYGARSNSDKYMVMSFNVKSEEFSVIELPDGVKIREPVCKLVNYNGEMALVDDSDFEYGIVNKLNGNAVFEMWVRDESKGTWSRKHIEIPHWKETVGDRKLFFKGTIGTGELVFAPQHELHRRSFLMLYYNMVTNKLRECKIEGLGFRGHVWQWVETELDHADSPWFM